MNVRFLDQQARGGRPAAVGSSPPRRRRRPGRLAAGRLTAPRRAERGALTWFYWRQTGEGPRVIKLPNGQLRVRRSALGRWLGDLEQDAA